MGDAVDLIPFVSGVGEVTRAVSTSLEIADTVHDTKKLLKTSEKLLKRQKKLLKKYTEILLIVQLLIMVMYY